MFLPHLAHLERAADLRRDAASHVAVKAHDRRRARVVASMLAVPGAAHRRAAGPTADRRQ